MPYALFLSFLFVEKQKLLRAYLKRQKTATFASQLRVFAYAISCFGIVMFTFLAISGKINFKHLGYIFISLFMLSATGAVIDYFSGSHANLKSEFNDTYMNAVPRSSLGS